VFTSSRLLCSFLALQTKVSSPTCDQLFAAAYLSIQLKRETQISIPDLYNYTRDRRLINDLLEREARYLSFDYERLYDVVISHSPGAKHITAVEKSEGGNARVLIFSLDNGRKVVAKLPVSVAGPKRLTTNSDEATMEYSKFHTCLKSKAILTGV
jgi:hypothetical protein